MATIQNQTSSDLIRSNLRGRRFTHRSGGQDLSDTDWQFSQDSGLRKSRESLLSTPQDPGGTGRSRLHPPGSEKKLSKGEQEAQELLAMEIATSMIPVKTILKTLKIAKTLNTSRRANWKRTQEHLKMSPKERRDVTKLLLALPLSGIAAKTLRGTSRLIESGKPSGPRNLYPIKEHVFELNKERSRREFMKSMAKSFPQLP